MGNGILFPKIYKIVDSYVVHEGLDTCLVRMTHFHSSKYRLLKINIPLISHR